MEIKNKDLKKCILTISYKYKLSHLGSCLTAVDIIDEIYSTKKPDEKFILSSGHAGLALYVAIEKYLREDQKEHFHLESGYHRLTAEKIFEHHGVHPDRCEECHIDCSTGSLGQGLPISCGLALADRNKAVYVLLSDGEMNEGSCYEALEVAHEQQLSNLKVYINCNGWGAYKYISRDHIIDRCRGFTNVNITFTQTDFNNFPEWFNGQQAHYLSLDDEQYRELTEIYA